MKRCFALSCAMLLLTAVPPLARAANGDPASTIPVVAQRLLSDPARDRIYASLTESDSVAVISTLTLKVTKTLVVGAAPVGLAISPDGKKLYVALSGAMKIAVIDLTTLTVLPSVSITEKGYSLAAGSNNLLYVAPAGMIDGNGPILEVDATTGTKLAQVGPYQVSVNGFLQISPDRTTLYYGDSGGSPSTLRRYDLTTSPPSLVESSDGNTGSNGDDLKLSHNGQFLCYPNGAGNSQSYQTDLLDPADFSHIYGRLNVGAYPGPLAFGPDDTVAYEEQVSTGDIFAFSTSSFLRLATLHYTFSDDLSTQYDLTTDRHGHYLFFAESEAILVYDLLAQPAPASVSGTIDQAFTVQPAIYIGGEGSLTGALPPGLTFDSAARKIAGTPTQAGSYPVTITVSDGTNTVSADLTLAIYPHSKPLNISTRLQVMTGDDVLIAGFIIEGENNKDIVVRGLGPSLESGGQPVPGRLADPTIELHDSTGAIVAANDNYNTDPFAYVLGAIDLTPASSLEAALYRALAPGAYTVIERGAADSTGVGLVEVYDVDESVNGASDTYSRLANISTRGQVGVTDNVMIGGFITEGPDHAQVLVRGLGPSLASQGVASPLANPQLDLFNSNGTKIGSDDDWQDAQATEIQATGLAPADPLEAAIDISVSPGAYTAILSGVAGSTGVGLVEVFNIP